MSPFLLASIPEIQFVAHQILRLKYLTSDPYPLNHAHRYKSDLGGTVFKSEMVPISGFLVE